jgi:hypothetical protein
MISTRSEGSAPMRLSLNCFISSSALAMGACWGVIAGVGWSEGAIDGFSVVIAGVELLDCEF